MKKNNNEIKKEIVGFTPHPGQEYILGEIIEKFNDSVYLGKKKSHFVLNLGRGWGKTTAIIQLSCFISINYENQNILYISPTFRLAKKVFRDIFQSIEGAEFIKHVNKTDLIITFHNGNTLSMGSAENPLSHRGNNTNTVLFLDEAAYMDESMWYDVMQPAMMSRGKLVIFISTPNGKNWFWDLYLRAKAEDKGWYFYEGKSEDSPYSDPEEIEQVKKNNPMQYRIEYCAEFMDENYTVFQNIDEACTPMPFFGYNIGNEPIFFGIDLGKKTDYTCAVAMSKDYEVRDILQIQNSNDWDIIIPQIAEFYNKWKPIHGFIETNFNDRIFDELIREYHCFNLEKLFVEYTKKAQLVQNLQIVFGNVGTEDVIKKRIKIPAKNPTLPITTILYNELKNYQGKPNVSTGRTKWGASRGMHDDCVSALMQAAWSVTNKGNTPGKSNRVLWENI